MAQIRLGVGQVNITNYLIAVARKTTTPLVIEAQEAYAPPHPATRNVVVPAVGSIDPVIYYVDFYESTNGVSLDLLLSQFVYDLKNQVVIFERRFYVVGGPLTYDPPANQDTLTDAYLDGKTISGFFKSGQGYLRPNTEPIVEWIPVTGGGIQLQNNLIFSQDEVYCVEISYLANQTQIVGGGLYNGVQLIDVNTTLNSSYRGKRLRCEASASSTLVVTLESVASVPDGTFYHFTTNGGTHNQTRILPFGSETIKYNGENYPEIWIGKGEFVRIVKVGSIWEAEMAHDNILKVGEHFSGTWKDHPSSKPEDGTLYDGDEWPRPWWWLKNKLPSTHYIVDDNVVNGGYTHPAGQEGLFVLHSSLKKFRLPNTQNISERGLKNFNSYGADAQRVYDYPGGVQNESVGPANIKTTAWTGNGIGHNGVSSTSVGFLATLGDGGLISSDSASGTNNNSARTITFSVISPGGENRVKNFGVVYLRRF
jgi:hypothetical protein